MPCPPPTITARWSDVQAYCGDNVRLQATVTPAPADGPVTLEILHMTGTGAPTVVQTLNPPMADGQINATWVAKAPSASWRTDRMKFRVTVPGVATPGLSSNEFTFRARPTVAWALRNIAHVKTDPALGSVFEYHDASLDADKVHFRFKLRTIGGAFDDTKKAAAKTVIEQTWNDGFSSKKFHRTGCGRGRACDCAFDCCKAGYRLDVDFVTSGEHVLITVVVTAPGAPRQGSSTAAAGGRPITMTWGDPPRNAASTYAHEIGHVLGHFDEYSPPVGGNDPTGAQPVSPPAGDENLLSTSGNTRLLNRHFRHALRYLNDQAASDTYEIIPP